VGGVGKTRLALEVAGHERSASATAHGCASCAARRWRGGGPCGCRRTALQQRQGLDIEATVIEYLAARELLLIVDNCEHYSDPSARLVDQIVKHCPG
jgi:predicted ATPase